MTTDFKLNTIQGLTVAVSYVTKAMLTNKEQVPNEMGSVLSGVISMIEKRGSAEVKALMSQVRQATGLPCEPSEERIAK